MKGIERYKMILNCKFVEYHDLFLQNSLRCNKYIFIFQYDATVYVGIPHALTFLTTYDDDEKFALQITSPENMIGYYKIPYREIISAKEMKGDKKSGQKE